MGTSKILCLSAFLMNFKWLFHLRIYQSSEKIVIGFDSIYLDHFLRIQSITTGKINLSFRMGTSKILSLGFNSKELLNGSSVYSLLFNTSHAEFSSIIAVTAVFSEHTEPILTQTPGAFQIG